MEVSSLPLRNRDLEIESRSSCLVARWPHLPSHLTSSSEFSYLLNDLGEVICKMGTTLANGCRVPGLSLNQINPMIEKWNLKEGNVVCKNQAEVTGLV